MFSICWLHSIGLDPLYPSQCSWETFGYATGGGFNGDAEGLSPLRLAGQLNSMGCSVSFHQGNSVSLIKLIEQVCHIQAITVQLVGHGVQATVDYQLWRDQSSCLTFSLANIPLEVWLLASLSPLLVVVVNEVVKLHEIRYVAIDLFT
ncbi:hypothetical protein GOODEAATRI_025966 [Goodea atripinnis]|uniref:Uncharacterized protein n=1 Tax=Goodea atripinnis TaxID=208336 RepID=A0ABV0N4F8_9TELE